MESMIVSQKAYNNLGSQGVQPWSVGGIYPFVVQGVQANPDSPVKYGVLCPNGEFRMAGSCDNAIKLGALLKRQKDEGLNTPQIDAYFRWLVKRDQNERLKPEEVSKIAQGALDNGSSSMLEAVNRFAKYRFMVEA